MSNWYPLKICRTHRGKLSYPVSARNPDAAAGENFGDKNSPQVSYLRSLQPGTTISLDLNTKLKGLKLLTYLPRYVRESVTTIPLKA